jgi:hypothetical protein
MEDLPFELELIGIDDIHSYDKELVIFPTYDKDK